MVKQRLSVMALLEQVKDPEVPVISIIDLGIVRDVQLKDDNTVDVTITPTYSGCPAMDVISMEIRMVLMAAGFSAVRIHTILSPAWTTDWMTESGKASLEAYGIAPPMPVQQVCHTKLFAANEAIRCPHCHSYHTTLISEFGSTACKSLYRCEACQEPFDYFKCH